MGAPRVLSGAAVLLALGAALLGAGRPSGVVGPCSTVRAAHRVGNTSTSCVAGSTTTTTTLTPAVDWSGSMLAWYPQEGSYANVNGTGGSNCSLTDDGGSTWTSTAADVVQGTNALVMANGATSFGKTTTCNSLNINVGTSPLTVGAAVLTTGTTDSRGAFDYENTAGTGGWFVVDHSITATSTQWSCGWDGAGPAGNRIDGNSVGTQCGSSGGYCWGACRYDGSGNVSAYWNGAKVAGPSLMTSPAPAAPGNGTELDVPSGANFQTTGFFDDGFIFLGNMADASLCRICTCNVDGKACGPNACNGTAYRSCAVDSDCGTPAVTGACDTTSGLCQGRRHTRCGDCTMPATCSQSTP